MPNQILTTNTQSDSAGIVNQAQGIIVGDAGTPAAQTFAVGFKVRHLLWVNITTGIRLEWFDGMANGSAISTTAAGVVTIVAGAGPVFGTGALERSFTMPATAFLASDSYVWAAQG